jgi:hypothetical protein
VPHNVVEAKTRSNKKLVMQLDRDVQVCGIFLFVSFLSTPCFEILLLFLFWRGHAFFLSFFSILLVWSTFFYASLSISSLSFFNDPFLLL